MISVVGPQDTKEHAAASDLRDTILRTWPASAGCEHDIRIVAGAKCHGQSTRDIDVLVLASLGTGLGFQPFSWFQAADGDLYRPQLVNVSSLCLVIEVKDHNPEAVRFIGTTVEVTYNGKPHNASEQNEKQLYAVKNYLEQHGIHCPHITPLLWLRNVPNSQLPARPHNILGSTLTWDLLLDVVAQLSPPRRVGDKWVLSATSNVTSLARSADLFTKTLTPTRLDRQRMERVASHSLVLDQLQQGIGSWMTILRGRGGTGKTLHLLQLALALYEEKDARILLLTYNKALVADIRRLLTIIGVGDDVSSHAVHIQTVHSFLYSALRGLGIIDGNIDSFLEDFEALKNQALDYLTSGAVDRADIEALVSSDIESFRWDYVFVDEAQDWPENERDLLLFLYPYTHIAVADGIDQLVRSTTPADWRGNLSQSQARIVPLRRCLRMKAGIARFVTAMAQNLGFPNLEWEANSEASGGRVIVVDGPYFRSRALHDRLLQQNVGDGNAPVDMLFCVPPSLISHHANSTRVSSIPAAAFEQWGLPAWDGAADSVRDTYPTDVSQLRIVQYDSCRGLEGWIVVNFALDSFYSHKFALGQQIAAAKDATLSPRDDEAFARHFAATWLLIPMTRAMDTLVIQLDQEYSPVREALAIASEQCGDYVEWLSLREL